MTRKRTDWDDETELDQLAEIAQRSGASGRQWGAYKAATEKNRFIVKVAATAKPSLPQLKFMRGKT